MEEGVYRELTKQERKAAFIRQLRELLLNCPDKVITDQRKVGGGSSCTRAMTVVTIEYPTTWEELC